MPYPHAASVVGDLVPTALIEGLEQANRQVITYVPPGAGRSTRRARLDRAEMLDSTEEALEPCFRSRCSASSRLGQRSPMGGRPFGLSIGRRVAHLLKRGVPLPAEACLGTLLLMGTLFEIGSFRMLERSYSSLQPPSG